MQICVTKRKPTDARSISVYVSEDLRKRFMQGKRPATQSPHFSTSGLCRNRMQYKLEHLILLFYENGKAEMRLAKTANQCCVTIASRLITCGDTVTPRARRDTSSGALQTRTKARDQATMPQATRRPSHQPSQA